MPTLTPSSSTVSRTGTIPATTEQTCHGAAAVIRGCTVAAVVCLGLAGPAGAQQAAFVVDTAESRVRIELGRAGLLKFLGHDHLIEAPLAAGRIVADAGEPARSSVELAWDAARLAIVPGSEPAGDVPEVEKRMRGAEVLDVEAHPEIRFASRSVGGAQAGPGVYRLRVRGVLTLRGQPREIEVPLDVRVEQEVLIASGRVALRLRDLGVTPPSVGGVVKVSNDFRVDFEIHARRRPVLTGPPDAEGPTYFQAPSRRRASTTWPRW
jgi:polyisoprenoid-binding protein YceI